MGKMKVEPQFIQNDEGAKVYLDPSNHEMLWIPNIDAHSKHGVIYDVLSVGYHYTTHTPCVTIIDNGTPKVYLLPVSLSNWVRENLRFNLFPKQVSFYNDIETDRTYAKLL